MTLQLLTVPTKLNALSLKLGYDADIQNNINRISAKTSTAANSFKATMTNEGSQVLVNKSMLMTSLSPSDVKITNMKSSLNAATRALQANKKQVISLQTDIHSNVESCRGRKTAHESELTTKRTRISTIRSEIESLETSIQAHDTEASTVENGAAELDKRAHDIRQAARRKRKRAGLGGIIGGVVGVVFAPFTGGASLALATAAAGINAGININDADDCDRNARRLRDEAATKRNHVQTLRSKKASLDGQKASLESEIAKLQNSTDKLNEASRVLQEVTDFLRRSINDIDNVLNVFQNMDTAMAEALLQTDSFKIIQNAFAQQPEKLGSRAQVYLDQLKGKWTQLETVLLQHGAKSISC
ncbi:uncharacterized protein LOC123547252 isoform X2 [Mercenaria mercenaria]|uniref:uncharacterized protein LOC123547252 isoform X3 n=1 Tax=Mercenaria mercenaria TaxID=6596 RepID=UPI00234E9092|nr:uncharacterized protein LOC123547252 isoform X3 [Mercenaria mercenaria]XP_053407510.1 uncharacterized protein LOC123547252 isoform X2 [Mercenaria mercenaria]